MPCKAQATTTRATAKATSFSATPSAMSTLKQTSPPRPGSPIAYAGGSLIPPAWRVKGTGDYDGNGINDILWRNESATDALGGYNYVFLMDGTTLGAVRGVNSLSNFLPAPYNLIPVSLGWDIVYTQTQ